MFCSDRIETCVGFSIFQHQPAHGIIDPDPGQGFGRLKAGVLKCRVGVEHRVLCYRDTGSGGLWDEDLGPEFQLSRRQAGYTYRFLPACKKTQTVGIITRFSRCAGEG